MVRGWHSARLCDPGPAQCSQAFIPDFSLEPWVVADLQMRKLRFRGDQSWPEAACL